MPDREEWIQQVRDAERRGEQLLAFDLAERALDEYPDDLWLRHRAVLALARAGSTAEAARRFDEYALGSVDDEDVQSLRARIAKDIALAGGREPREAATLRAAQLYRGVFERTGGAYPGVNAATLLLLAGKTGEAREIAARVLERLPAEPDYYAAATEAEALLVLGRPDDATEALDRAAQLHGGDWGAVSATRRQLRLVCSATGADDGLLATIAGRRIVHFCGHRISGRGTAGRFPEEGEHAVAERIATEIERDPPAAGYGALANGADILCAEALLASGAELHVVLPFAIDDFVQTSVADAGAGWVARFQHCLDAAETLTLATEDASLGDDTLYRYGSELAMGLAILRGGFLDAPVHQIAVWDGQPATSDAGTAIDVETWRCGGCKTIVIAPPASTTATAAAAGVAPARAGRVVRALMFGDVYRFSGLTDTEMLRFLEHVLGGFAATLDRHGATVEHRNTWGDAIYVVFTDAPAAAACALDLQDAMAAVDLARVGLPGHLALRLGLHLGPVLPVTDPITGNPVFMGAHVSRAARIEPVTPPGAVYVTNHVAASLVLHQSPHACDYVGHVPAAKDYGRLPMYRLRRRAQGW